MSWETSVAPAAAAGRPHMAHGRPLGPRMAVWTARSATACLVRDVVWITTFADPLVISGVVTATPQRSDVTGPVTTTRTWR